MSKHLISISGVNKRYTRGKTEVPVRENLSLDVERGDFLALMGSSGSGKTTLLNLMGGLIGSALAWLAFDSYTASTIGESFSQVSFDYAVTWDIWIDNKIDLQVDEALLKS